MRNWPAEHHGTSVDFDPALQSVCAHCVHQYPAEPFWVVHREDEEQQTVRPKKKQLLLDSFKQFLKWCLPNFALSSKGFPQTSSFFHGLDLAEWSIAFIKFDKLN